jgi:thioredoxin 1
MGHALRLTDTNFEQEVLAADTPVLVDFWASWCPPCKMMEPVIEELAADYNGRLKVGKLHVDQNPKTASLYQILGVPTFALFQAGKILQQRVGAQSKTQLVQMLSTVL